MTTRSETFNSLLCVFDEHIMLSFNVSVCMHCCVDQMGGGKVKKPGKRGRKPAKIDLKAKLERSRQSARECRARKKLRYQYLEELVSSKERAICALREELEMVHQLLINILILDDNNSINNWLKFARRTKVNVSTKKTYNIFTVLVFVCRQYKQWCSAMDQGKIPSEIKALLTGDEQRTIQSGGNSNKTSKNKNNISSNGQS